MENFDCKELVKRYSEWLQEETNIRSVGEGVCEITTPFLDRHNDYIQIYITQRENLLVFSDGGYSLAELKSSGVELREWRKGLFEEIIRAFGVTQENGQLIAVSSYDEAPQRKLDLVQAILAVSDMYISVRPYKASVFKYEVESVFIERGVRFMPTVRLLGKSGLNHNFDYVVPRSRTRPDRLLKTLAHPDRNSATSYVFQVSDVRPVRDEFEALAVMNDIEYTVKSEIEQALKQYSIVPFRWSQRERFIQRLID
ncbi:DUF1829 domain-containing protein [candidate division WOR-3 bacterium]|nr:DUF1829 domain-containing protein [candidate division WOR-3 bacterium]